MKKLLTVVLILALLLPAAALAEDTLYSANFATGEEKTYIMNIFKTSERIYVLGYEFDLKKNGFPYWEADGDIKLRMDNGVHTIRILDGALSYEVTPMKGDYITLTEVMPGVRPPEPEKADAIPVPQGMYTAGEDFPAGTYRITLQDEKNGGSVRLYENAEKSTKAFSYMHEYDLGSFYGTMEVGKIEIQEGNVLEVRSTTIVLSPYTGLSY